MHLAPNPRLAPIVGRYVVPDAAAYYRLAVPLGAIGGGWGQVGDGLHAQTAQAQTIVMSRFAGPPDQVRATIADLQRRGIRVLADYDDDPDSAGAAARARFDFDGLRAGLRAADGMVTTNRTLASRLRRYGRSVRVLPNFVRPEDWPAPAPVGDGPTIVTLAGSASHEADWAEVVGALAAVRRAYGERVWVRVAGHLPATLRHVVDEHRPWRADLTSYPAMLAGSHIGLCPLLRSTFNVCKSPIKLYEFALSGAAVIGSPTQYGPVLDAAGLADAVARVPMNWDRLIRHYLDRPDQRAADAAALRAFVVATVDVARHTETIRAAYAD